MNSRKKEISEKMKENMEIVRKATGWSFRKARKKMERARENGMSYYRYAHNECWKMKDKEIKELAVELKEKARLRQQRIFAVCEATGWNPEKAKGEMERARENGMSYYRYVKHECWKMNDEEIRELAVELKEKEKSRQEKIAAICEATGWSTEKVKEEIKYVKTKGISLKQYIDKCMYDLSHDEIEEFAGILEKRKSRWRNNFDFYVDLLCEKSGFNKERAAAELDRAKLHGISYRKYMQEAGWEFADDNMEQLIHKAEEHQKQIEENREIWLEKICNATGWSKAKAELEVSRSKNETGASYEDFYVFQFYDLPIEKQKEYVTLDLFTKMRLKYNDHSIAQTVFDNKENFNRTFADKIRRKWFTNMDLSYDEFLQHIEGLDAVIVKELTATQGAGIHTFQVNRSEVDNRKVYEEIMQLKNSIVEQYIIQHDETMKFCPTSVNTVRVTTLNYQNECKFLYAVFRMGCGGIVDNFHAGGIAATVNLDTGITCTDAADLEGNVYEIHPYSGLKIKGFKIPHWDKVIEVCREINGRVEGVNLVGWDFAITPGGVDLIEGNSGASYVVAQIPNVKDKIGLRSVMVDPYL